MFEKIVGHERVIKHLEKEIKTKEVSHAYLFSGIEGIGKKKVALEFAKALLCRDAEENGRDPQAVAAQIEHNNHPDVKIMTPKAGEATIKISQVREMISGLAVKPYSGNWRIQIIEGAEKLTTEAQNSLLKSLEEPLSYNIFILITSQLQALLPTIRSRCQSYHFQPLKIKEIEKVISAEGPFDGQELQSALSQSEGSPGKALYYLHNAEIPKERTRYLRELYSLLKGDQLKIFALAEALAQDKRTSEEMLEFFIHWFYEVELLLEGQPLPQGEKPGQAHQAYYQLLEFEKNQQIIKTLFEMMMTIQYNVNLRLQWEKCFIKIMRIGRS